MREFWVRLVSMLAIVGVLLGYNSVLDARAKEDEIARLSAQVVGNGQSDSENGDSTNYKDGTYTGEADGFGGTIQVEVKIEKSKTQKSMWYLRKKKTEHTFPWRKILFRRSSMHRARM